MSKSRALKRVNARPPKSEAPNQRVVLSLGAIFARLQMAATAVGVALALIPDSASAALVFNCDGVVEIRMDHNDIVATCKGKQRDQAVQSGESDKRPVPARRGVPSPAAKSRAEFASDRLGLVAAVCAGGALFPGPSQIPFAALSALTWIAQSAATLVAKDPPDQNFKTAVPVPTVSVQGFPPAVTDMAHVALLLNAMAETVNRASGAADSGDTAAVKLQSDIFRDLEKKLAGQMFPLGKDLPLYGQQVKTDQIDPASITPARIAALQKEGLPPAVKDALRKLGASDSVIADFTDNFSRQNPDTISRILSSNFNVAELNNSFFSLSQALSDDTLVSPNRAAGTSK